MLKCLIQQFVHAIGTAAIKYSVTGNILNIFRIVYGSFNLDMLNIDGLSFCIISAANVMDIFMFNYCTVL